MNWFNASSVSELPQSVYINSFNFETFSTFTYTASYIKFS